MFSSSSLTWEKTKQGKVDLQWSTKGLDEV